MKKILVIIFCFVIWSMYAGVSLPSYFSDHMVLQQKAKMKFWGWGNPTEKITIVTSWDNASYQVSTDNMTHWEVYFTTPEAGGPHTISLKGDNEIVLKDILIGEVWLCSGQSQMEWTASAGIDGAEEAIQNANYPNIRFFSAPKQASNFPKEDLNGNWQVCSSETMPYFSAVGYFFGKELFENLDVPIGLVHSSWGGSYAESWIPQETFLKDKQLDEATHKLIDVPWAPNKPSVVYNAMIAPLTSLNITGVIWYQGESNTANPKHYEYVFSSLIHSWRKVFNQDFPFYYAQIAPFTYGGTSGVEVRDAQRRVLAVEKTGMVVTSDIGNINDIHPKNKKDVGLRFANIALKKHYKAISGVVEGPTFSKVKFDGCKAIVSFDNSLGLKAKSKTSLFEIAGEDKVFYSAKFKIKNEEVILSSKEVKLPKYVRFAWDNIAESNVFNIANLPASSFTTEF